MFLESALKLATSCKTPRFCYCTQLIKLYDTRFSRGHSEPFVQSAVAAALTNWHQSNASECQFEQEPLWFSHTIQLHHLHLLTILTFWTLHFRQQFLASRKGSFKSKPRSVSSPQSPVKSVSLAHRLHLTFGHKYTPSPCQCSEASEPRQNGQSGHRNSSGSKWRKNGCYRSHVSRGWKGIQPPAQQGSHYSNFIGYWLYWMLLAILSTALNSRLNHLCICLEMKLVWILETFEGAASCARVCHSGWNCILSHLCKESQWEISKLHYISS